MQLHGMANPYKLAHAASLLDVETVFEEDYKPVSDFIATNQKSISNCPA